MRAVHALAIGLLASSPAAGEDACEDIDGDGRTDIVGCDFAERDNPLEVWIRRK